MEKACAMKGLDGVNASLDLPEISVKVNEEVSILVKKLVKDDYIAEKSCLGDGKCNGNGICSTQTGKCVCYDGFRGPLCEGEIKCFH